MTEIQILKLVEFTQILAHFPYTVESAHDYLGAIELTIKHIDTLKSQKCYFYQSGSIRFNGKSYHNRVDVFVGLNRLLK